MNFESITTSAARIASVQLVTGGNNIDNSAADDGLAFIVTPPSSPTFVLKSDDGEVNSAFSPVSRRSEEHTRFVVNSWAIFDAYTRLRCRRKRPRAQELSPAPVSPEDNWKSFQSIDLHPHINCPQHSPTRRMMF